MNLKFIVGYAICAPGNSALIFGDGRPEFFDTRPSFKGFGGTGDDSVIDNKIKPVFPQVLGAVFNNNKNNDDETETETETNNNQWLNNIKEKVDGFAAKNSIKLNSFGKIFQIPKPSKNQIRIVEKVTSDV